LTPRPLTEASLGVWIAGVNAQASGNDEDAGLWCEADIKAHAPSAPVRRRRTSGERAMLVRAMLREYLVRASAGPGGRASARRELAMLPARTSARGPAAGRGSNIATALREAPGPVVLAGDGSVTASEALGKLAADLDGEAALTVREGTPRRVLRELGLEVDKRTARSCWALLAQTFPGLVCYTPGLVRVTLGRFLDFAEWRASGPIDIGALLQSWHEYMSRRSGDPSPADGVYEQQSDHPIPDLGGLGGTEHAGLYSSSRTHAFNTMAPRAPAVRGPEGEPEGLQESHGVQSASGALAGEEAGRAPAPSAGAEEAQPTAAPMPEGYEACKPAGLTGSAWILRVQALHSKRASLAAALVLEHERATSEPWRAVGSATTVVRQLLEAYVLRHGRSTTVRSREVRDYAAGMQALADSGCVRQEQDDAGAMLWSKPRAALSPVLELYGIDPRPVTARVAGKVVVQAMPTDLHEIALGRNGRTREARVPWMAQCKAPTDAQRLFLARLGIDASRLSRAEASVLQGKLHHRYHHLGTDHALRHDRKDLPMHLLTNIDHLLTIDGVVAVTIATPGGQAFRGVEPWAPRLAAVIAVFALCDEPTMIVRIGEHTAHVQREGDQVAAVVIPTGHAIAKSLRRHIRRAAKSAPTRLPTREAEARADALAQHLDEVADVDRE
jgi:hypothetical protein